jgi:FkbM family methyltransferase
MVQIVDQAKRFGRFLMLRAGYRILLSSYMGVDLDADLVRVCGKKARVIFDIGAGEGDSALLLRKLFPKAEIYSFEPYQPAYTTAQSRLVHDTRTHLADYALGDREAAGTLFCNQGSQQNSMLPNSPHLTPYAPRELFQPIGTAETQIRTVERVCQERGITSIDLLKIDTQGYELHVLRGAASLLQRRAVTAVLLELLFAPYYDGQAYFEEIYSLMLSYQYRLVGLYHMIRGDDHAILCCVGVFMR